MPRPEHKQLVTAMLPILWRLLPALAVVLFVSGQNASVFGTAGFQIAARPLLAGEIHYGFAHFDERLMKRTMARGLQGRPLGTLLAGSSRVMELEADCFEEPYFNAAVPGATIEDIGAMLHVFEAGRRIGRIVLSADPWMLNGAVRGEPWNWGWHHVAEDWVASEVEAGLAPSARDLVRGGLSLMEPMREIFAPVAFQAALKILVEGRQLPRLTPNNWFRWEPDGSIRMPDFIAMVNAEKADQEALANAEFHLGTIYRNFKRIDPAMAGAFEGLAAHAASRGSRVTLLLHPMHPAYYAKVTATESGRRIMDAEQFYRRLAAGRGFEIAGSYDADRMGVTAADFRDGIHLRKASLKRVFGCREGPHP